MTCQEKRSACFRRMSPISKLSSVNQRRGGRINVDSAAGTRPRLAAADLRALGGVGRGNRGARGGLNPNALREPFVTGSLGGKHLAHVHKKREKVDEEDEFEDE